MPVNFLTPEHKRRYGNFDGEPSPDQFTRYFYLYDFDREIINKKNRFHNRLGFAIQLGTVRFLGTFLNDPCDVPSGVITMMRKQLGIEDASCMG